MRKIYLKILLGIMVLLWIIYFIQNINADKNRRQYMEGFTPKIRILYRPYVRRLNQGYESFLNNYSPNIIVNKLRKWNIY